MIFKATNHEYTLICKDCTYVNTDSNEIREVIYYRLWSDSFKIRALSKNFISKDKQKYLFHFMISLVILGLDVEFMGNVNK